MKAISIFLVLSCVFSLTYATANCKPSISTAQRPHNSKICSGQLIFEENFEILDKDLWKSEITLRGGGNNEFQWYTDDDENRFVKNGKLHLRPTLTVDKIGAYDLEHGFVKLNDCTDPNPENCQRQARPGRIINPIRCARLNTVGSFSFKFGRVEVIAKIPTGDWLWPAIWFLPTNGTYGAYPRSGEIDLMESRGNRKYIDDTGKQIGVERVGSAIHFGPQWNRIKSLAYKVNNPNGYNDGFHKYEMLWDDQGIRFSVDDGEIGFVPVGDGIWRRGRFSGDDIWGNGTKMAPFDAEFHFVLNLAVGGTSGYFPDDGNQNGAKPWKIKKPQTAATDFWNGRSQWLDGWNLNENNGESASLIIDSIKVWAI